MYVCLSKQRFEDTKGYSLEVLREIDIEKIRIWRNAQKAILRQTEEISVQKQNHYFHQVIRPTFVQKNPEQVLFSYFLYDKHGHDTLIGYGGLTHIDWENERGEVSFLLDPEFGKDPLQYRVHFLHFLKLLVEVAFRELQLNRLFTETYSYRSEHMKVLEEFGFQMEGILRENVFKDQQKVDSVIHGLLKKDSINF